MGSIGGSSGLVGLMILAFAGLRLELPPRAHRHGVISQLGDVQRRGGARRLSAALVFGQRRLANRAPSRPENFGRGLLLGFSGVFAPLLQQPGRDGNHAPGFIAIANLSRKQNLRLGDRRLLYASDMSATKSLSNEQNRLARALIEKLSERYDTEDALADALGVSQGHLNEVRNGSKGVGGKVLAGLTKLAPAEALTLLGASPAAAPVDTLAMASAAAESLVKNGLASQAEAWTVMREIRLSEPSADGFYQEARRRLLAGRGRS